MPLTNFDMMSRLKGAGLTGFPGGQSNPMGGPMPSGPSPAMPNPAINTGARSPSYMQRMGRTFDPRNRQGFGNLMQGIGQMGQAFNPQGQPPPPQNPGGFQQAFSRAMPLGSNMNGPQGQPFQNRRTDFSQMGF